MSPHVHTETQAKLKPKQDGAGFMNAHTLYHTVVGGGSLQTWNIPVMLFPGLDGLLCLCIEIRHTLCGFVMLESGSEASVTDPLRISKLAAKFVRDRFLAKSNVIPTR
jgi:hypothetical protein